MKHLFFSGLLLIGFTSSLIGQNEFYTQYQKLLANHVKDNLVDYGSISDEQIESIRSSYQTISSADLSASERTKFFVNLYNFEVLYAIKKAGNINSVTEIPYFFTKERQIAGRTTSFDELEHQIIKDGANPLLHLFLNCGSRGCPKLQFFENINDASIRDVLNEVSMVHIVSDNSEIQLNKVFFWNINDFKGEKALKELLNPFFPEVDITDLVISYQEYDWTSNSLSGNDILIFYPTKLYGKGAGEVKIFNNYYTQSDNGFRSNFFSSFIQVQFGTASNFNWGFDVKLRSVNQGRVGVFSALNFQDKQLGLDDDNVLFSRVGITGIGPRVRYQPFKNKGNINILHAIYFVPQSDSEGNELYGYSDFNNLQIFNNIWYEKDLSIKRRLFFDIGFHIENIKFNIEEGESHFMQFQIPVTGIYNFIPNPNTTFYLLANAALKPVFFYDGPNNRRYETQGFAQVGAGTKYYITDNIEIEALYTYFIDGTPGRQAHTFNLGLRFFRFTK